VGYAAGLQSTSNNGGGIFFRTVPQNSVSIAVERMRIDENGNIGIGTTTPTQRLDVVGNIAASGTVSASGTTLTSDARLKSNVVGINNGLSKIMALRPVNYDKKFDLDSAAAVNEHGFIAQELQKIMPELVTEGKDEDKLLSINYTAIIPVLTKAIQEQQVLIEANQTTIQKQQEQIDELTFQGSECTMDCSGHRAGYEWSKRRGGLEPASWSPSFNKGAAIHRAEK
jgi:hypothetical protein